MKKIISGIILTLTMSFATVANAGLIDWSTINDGDYFSIRSGAEKINANDTQGVPQIPVLFVEAIGGFANYFGNAAGYSVDTFDLTQPSNWELSGLWDFSNGVAPFEGLTLSWLANVLSHDDSLVSFDGDAIMSDLSGMVNLTGIGQIENKIAQSGAIYGQYDATFTAYTANTGPGNGNVDVPEPSTIVLFGLAMIGLVNRKKLV